MLLSSFGLAHAEQMVFSRSAFVSTVGQEMSVADSTAWKIPILPSQICLIGQSCPAILIDGLFKVGDNGEVRSGNVALTSQQLGGQPLWIMSGAKVTIPVDALGTGYSFA